MEATLFTSPSTKFPNLSSRPQSRTLKTQFLNPILLTHNPNSTLPRSRGGATTIRSAISRSKKEETVETVKEQLKDCHLIAGIAYKGLTVQQFRNLRSALPETTKLLVAKNNLVYKAIEDTPWAALKPCMKGMNAWLFVHSEEIPAALKPFRTFQKETKVEGNDFSGAVFEGKYYAPADFKALETLPTRAEIYANFLGSLKGPATAVVGTLQAPARNLVLTLKAYVKKLEEESGGAQ